MLTVGDTFPAFVAKGCLGADAEGLTEVRSEEYEGKWVVYFFYPKDFTFVCPTEIVEFNKKLRDFQDRDTEVVGGSTDNEYSHLAWCQSREDLRDLRYPLIGAQKLALALGVL
ncbi:MAG TPA: redoxin domain-containing protein, partial [Isosphaeraceae bacterium]|nr:redoxin domain-containing protein [Isosphaeraceae bacterium]